MSNQQFWKNIAGDVTVPAEGATRSNGVPSEVGTDDRESALFKLLIASAPHGIVVTEGAPHVLRDVNEAFCRMARLSPEAARGANWAELFRDSDNSEPLAILDRVFERGQAEERQDIERFTSARERMVWAFSVWPIQGEHGGRTGLVIEIRDRTDEANAREGLEQMTEQIRQFNERLLGSALHEQEWAERAEAANRAKSDFLAMISHELRTPLTGICGYIEVLDAEVGGPINERQREYLDRIRLCSSQLRELIEDILSFAKVEAGTVVIDRESIDVCEVAREAAAVVQPAASLKHLTFEIEMPEERLVIETDPRKIRQILLNLLTNAVKFTDAGSVRLELRQAEGEVRLLVRDTGIGIAHEEIDRIFEPFTQAEQIITRRHGGSGLGLAISRTFALMLDGELRVESELGAGSTFSLHLPTSRSSLRH